MATNQIATLGVKVDPRGAVTGANRAKRAITGIGNSARNVKNRIMSMQGALLGLGAGAVLKSIITTASSVESLQVRLKFLTGSTEEAAKAFETMNTFASKVPFSLEEIERASPLLLTVAKDASELNNLLEITGDIAAISGLSFEATAGQLQRSMAGGIAAADLFRERGVKAFLGFKEGVQYSASETKKIIEDMFRNGTTTAKGATKELANTFTGQVSFMQDAWRKLKLAIADAGVFEITKNAIIRITEELNDPQTLKTMKELGKGLTTIGKESGKIIEQFMSLPPEVKTTGLVLALLGGTAGRMAVVGVIAFKEELKEIFTIWDSGLALFGKTPTTMDGLVKALEKASFEAEIYRATLRRIIELQNGNIFEKTGAFLVQGGTSSAQNDVNKAEERVRKLEEAIKSLKLSLMLEDLDLKPITSKAITDLTEFANMYVQSLKPISDINKFLSGQLKLETLDMTERQGLPEHLRHISDEAVEVAKKFYDNTIPATTHMGIAFDKLAKIASDAKEKTKEFADGMATNIEDSIMRMTQGLMSFKDVVKSVFQYVAAEMVRANIAKPLAGALSGILTGSGDYGGKGDGGILGKVFSGMGFASGGRPPVGQASVVGERGAELFVPDSAGTIVPNNQMGGQTINVTYAPNVNALDPRTAQIVIAENAPTIVSVIRQAFNQNGQEVAI